MSGDDIVRLISTGTLLVLIAASLFARRLPIGQTVRMALSWLAIFAFVFVLFLFRDEGQAIWNRARGELSGSRGVVAGGTLRLPMRDDGHFWVEAQVNGVTAEFLVDSGATTTAIGAQLARSAGLAVDDNFPVSVDTANGRVRAMRTRIPTLVIGPLRQDNAPALVSDAFGDTNVLGMSFLSSLRSWRVEGPTLVLEPSPI